MLYNFKKYAVLDKTYSNYNETILNMFLLQSAFPFLLQLKSIHPTGTKNPPKHKELW